MMLNIRAIIFRLQLLVSLSIVSTFFVSAQSSEEMKNIFTQAESYFIYEEYELANQLYLLIEAPENMNLKYKIGTCYINIAGEKEKSIPYLEEAVKTSSFDSKTESYKELRAPLEVYFFLAKAYMINNEFEKALNTLQTFSRLVREASTKGKMENFEYIDQQIQACKNAIQFTQVPVVFTKEILGRDFSMGSLNENPAVSFDGKTIVYTERRGIQNAIFFSRKVNGNWQSPVEITSDLKAGTDCSSCSLNSDGTELFLYKTDNYDGSLYSSKYINDVWTPIVKLNKNINTKFYESHAAVSADGKKLYFASNREGGQGNLDIYVSEKDKSGNWGPAVNLGAEINTPFNEDTPFLTKNDSILYFSSEGHNSMGGYDNYKSLKNGSAWLKPNNLGYPLNSADDDKFFQPANNGANAYYSITTDYKKKEIFYLDLSAKISDLPFKITGKFKLNDTTLVSEPASPVKIINRVSGDTLYRASPEVSTGIYSLNVAPGLYKISYSWAGYYTRTVDTMLVRNSSDMIINLDITLFKDTTTIARTEPVVYEKIDLAKIPEVAEIDSSILIKNVVVSDETDKSIKESDVLYFTVQVMALHKPVDVSYFKYIGDMKVMYSDTDKFYRYTTGKFQTREEAYAYRLKLISKGYPKQIFVKKITKL
jgi:hypothetical protein